MSVKTLVTVVKFIAFVGAVISCCATTADGFPVIYSFPPIHAIADAMWRIFQFGIDYPLVPFALGMGGMIFCAYKS